MYRIEQTENSVITPSNPKQDMHSGHGDESGFDIPNYHNETPDDSGFWATFFIILFVMLIIACG
jgi:hypothetical protein